MSIEVRSVRKQFGAFVALDDVNLKIDGGELVALLGPSGCGKTTLLRIIAGLQEATDGEVRFHGEDISNRTVRERHVGFVFQHYALFRHMTVFENVAFGLRVMPRKVRPPKDEIAGRVKKLLKLVQVDWLANEYPSKLSGGQRQRVALARALIIEPKVLLLDEPFGALDARVRRELRRWLRRLHDEIHVTSVFVTHDQEEALEVADRVVIMNEGRIVQEGSPDDVYDRPASPFVYGFLGSVNRFRSRLSAGSAEMAGISVPAEHEGAPDAAGEGSAFVRPQDFEVFAARPDGDAIKVEVTRISRIGPTVRLEVEDLPRREVEFEIELPRERFLEMQVVCGSAIYVLPRRVRVFPNSLAVANC